MSSLGIDYVTTSKVLETDYTVFLLDAGKESLKITLPLFMGDGIYFILKRVDSNILTTININASEKQKIIGGDILAVIDGSYSLIAYDNSWYVIN